VWLRPMRVSVKVVGHPERSDVAFTFLVLGVRVCGLAEMLDQTNDGIGA
jgi:hypothetical protein